MFGFIPGKKAPIEGLYCYIENIYLEFSTHLRIFVSTNYISMSKNTLIADLVKNGKSESWNELAIKHGLGSGEIARHTWRDHRAQKNIPARIHNHQAPVQSLSKESLLELIRKEATKHVPIVKYAKGNAKETLLELSIFDLHIGKLAWDKESGEDYDIDIAISRHRQAVEDLVSRVDPGTIEKILLPIGNDMINVDNKTNTTTAGTPQSSDSRFGKMFRAAKDLVISTIDRLSKIAPVDVVVVPGNHDEVTMFTLGEVLEAWYSGNKEVTIMNSPKLRKYYQYGANMIGFTHGDKERHTNLGVIMATEKPEMWGNTKYREWHLGHLHKGKTIQYTTGDEFPGFKIRILPSLSGTDAWHYAQGYMSAKAAKAFLWHKERGLITEHTFNI